MKNVQSSPRMNGGIKRLRALGALVCGLLLCGAVPGQTQSMEQVIREQEALYKTQRSQYIEVTRILQTPAAEQKPQIPRLYRLFSEIKETTGFSFSSIIYLRARLPKDVAQFSPEELADYITKSGGGNQYLSVEAKANGRQVLRTNLETVAPLIQADLRSDALGDVERGLSTLREIGQEDWGGSNKDSFNPQLLGWLNSFYEDVVKVPDREPKLEQSVVGTLVVLNDQRAIKLLIAKDPGKPTHYYEAIASLSEKDPKNAALLGLVPLLNSKDSRQRFEALWALGHIDSSILLPHVRRLLKDSDAQVRWLAVNFAFAANDSEFDRFRPQLIKALNDSDEFVRYVTSSGFVRKHDAVSAPTLLQLLKSPTASLSIKAAVADDVRRLMGNTFDYIVDGAVTPEQTIVARNQLALAKFEKWIAAGPAKSHA
ncbi:hypothetical protein IAD21_03534 [Abditibacteriota bacterium]|nr:hypothetical protein IAD21_03534 [Abditibacteriota bacterium]